LWPLVLQTDTLTRRQFGENGTPFGPVGLPTAPFTLWSLGFDAAWELDISGRLRRTVEAAGAEFEGSVEDRNAVLVRLLGEVARTYVELRTAQERLAAARENVRLQQETFRLTQERQRWGAAGPLEVSQAETQLAQTEAAIYQLEYDIKSAENRLCVLIGEPPRSLEPELAESTGIPRPPPQIAVGLPLDLLRRRPDVRRAEREVAAHCAQVGIAASDLYPQLSLTGTFTLDAGRLPTAFQGESLFYTLGPSVRWNVLNFGRVRGNVQAAQARLEQAVARYRQIVLQAAGEADSAIALLVQERKRQERLAAAVESARQAVRVAQQQYREGAVSFQSLLDAERILVQVQDQHVGSRGAEAAAAIALYKALGGGWEAAPEL
jgi:NodT family efflux transporter outer membrane factor (OMF) lipoprotein